MFNVIRRLMIPLTFASVLACGGDRLTTPALVNPSVLSDQQIARISSERIFFGHQSVGSNILDGVRELAATDPRLKVRILKSADPGLIDGPALMEFEIGQNGDPRSKDEAFAQILAKGFAARGGGIAMYKYCYADIDASTDLKQMFESYRSEISALKAKYPALQIVHITVPLTVAELGPKAWIRGLLGQATRQDANVKRNEFNRLLLQTYAGKEPIFDLAKVESTHADGSRSYFMRNGEMIYTLASKHTTDGGHLNESGRRVVAAALLQVLSEL